MTPSSRLILLVIGSLAAIGCNSTRDLSAVSKTQLTAAQIAVTPVQPVQAAPIQVAAPAAAPATIVAAPQPASAPMFEQQAPVGEVTLDTSANAPPVLQIKNKKSKVRTVSDENLPKWVPKKGRLTVVDSADLAENLGLVPKGATKKSDERISVADKLAEADAARVSTGDPMTQGSSWSYAKAGRVVNHRHR